MGTRQRDGGVLLTTVLREFGTSRVKLLPLSEPPDNSGSVSSPCEGTEM